MYTSLCCAIKSLGQALMFRCIQQRRGILIGTRQVQELAVAVVNIKLLLTGYAFSIYI